ncbi:MAG: pyruvate:ferredoxin (flavodoxin) oxidoreductase [Acidobacteriota bacterium]
MSEDRQAEVRMLDGNAAVASIAHRTSEICAIYPITPSSPMGELADEWSAAGRKNIWGAVPAVVEMQSEGGAAGALHGAVTGGALSSTFTASQGLLLMIPDLYKMAGELAPACLHVAARTVATHALSIFGDHSDVMACRQTGVALLASGSVQEAHDLAAVAQAATLRCRIPFVHFFDGFRTSHEVAKILEIDDDTLRQLIPDDLLQQHRARALTPDRPVLRGTAQNPDTFFQAREAANPTYLAAPGRVQDVMDALGDATGRRYHLFDYAGHPRPERVIVIMGSGAETVHETVDHLLEAGERVGVLKVRLYRPFDSDAFARALPDSTRGVAVLDRTKEPGGVGEPLYVDVLAALHETRTPGHVPAVIGGRYGLSSKEFTPAMVKAVFDELGREEPRAHFTVGIVDDVTRMSLPVNPAMEIEPDDVFRAVFFGLGSDGTVGANKNSIKIIGLSTDAYAQGAFVYDSRKAGSVTISHLRIGPRPIRSAYLIHRAAFVGCHQFQFLDTHDVLDLAGEKAVFLLNSPFGPDDVWSHLPREIQEQIIDKQIRFHVIDAYGVAKRNGLGGRINTIMQTGFFALTGILPETRAIAEIKQAIETTYGRKGKDVVARNVAAVDETIAALHEVRVPGHATATRHRPQIVADDAPDFVKKVTAVMLAGKGDLLPVSAFPPDGTWPVGTSRWEKRNLAQEIPIWDSSLCIQCNKCALICPHAAIRAKIADPADLALAPDSFRSTDYRGSEFAGSAYILQVAPEDCTGCHLCVELCPAKDKVHPDHKAINMRPQRPVRAQEIENYAFFLDLPEVDRSRVRRDNKGSQFLQPLFEASGACPGCGETPYIKLLTQLFGDHLLIANATGCSSIYGGNLPTTPYSTDAHGRGPAWSNSLFEDNAEFGLGFRLAIDSFARQARELLLARAGRIGDDLVRDALAATGPEEADITRQRRLIEEIGTRLADDPTPAARQLAPLLPYLAHKSVWMIGGDGWAYDIGHGGLDHVLSMDRDVNILVLDTEVYSNTGGQQSKATPLGASAKFAVAGKSLAKKDLGLMAMSYGHVYVARVAMGASDQQTVQALREADAHQGPSLVIAYAHCIAHGFDLRHGAAQQRRAVRSGVWPLYRFDPARVARGKPPLKLDSGPPRLTAREYMSHEARFGVVEALDPDRFRHLLDEAQRDVDRRIAIYQHLAGLTLTASGEDDSTQSPVR